MARFLFVCLGNICRSPAAAGFLRHLLEKANIGGDTEVDSCGVGDWYVGAAPDARMVQSLMTRGIAVQGRAKAFEPYYLDYFDYILAVDREVLNRLQAIATTPEQRAKIHLFTRFSPVYRDQDVPDPYYGGQQSFELVLDMIEDSCQGLVEELLRP